MRREGTVAVDPPPGLNKIPDPRRFVHVEACGTVGNAALSLSIGVHDQWIPSDRGLPQYRIVRDDCFRIATPLPPGTRPSDIHALRVHAFERPAATVDTNDPDVLADQQGTMLAIGPPRPVDSELEVADASPWRRAVQSRFRERHAISAGARDARIRKEFPAWSSTVST
jgi:hypothetical protein